MFNIIKNRGSVLLYALLIVSLITAIALTVSIIVVNEIKLTSSAADAVAAYYAAESGIERGLYSVKVFRADAHYNLSDAVDAINDYVDTNFTNKAEYETSQTDDKTSGIINQEVKEDKYVQAEYYDIDNPLNSPPIVEKLTIQNDDAGSSAWAEISWTAWDDTGTLGTSTNARRVIGPTDLLNEWPINLDVFGFGIALAGYRVRVRAMFDDLSFLTIRPRDAAGNEVFDLPSYIEIKSIGTRTRFKQSLTALVPWKVPLFGLYDYVLFSEGELYKTIILGQPVYSSGTIQIEAEVSGPFSGFCTGCGVTGIACGLPGASCIECGWLATECSSNNVICFTPAPPAVNYCLITINDWFTLPIPDTVPAGQEYYLSLRSQSTGGSELEVVINDPEEGELGLVITIPNTTDYTTCTIAEPISLSGESGRTIKFDVTLSGSNNVLLDWYQLSSYKIFSDCEE